MAHSYWGLSEIVRAIAANLVSDKTKASAVALACCSKSLQEPALGEVWRSLSSLTPLIQCFPPEAWEAKEDQLFFKRAPLRAEWTRFQQHYAPKVRHLEVSSSNEEIRFSALHLLRNLSDDRPLLPNLVSLDWESDDDFLPYISSFISRSLTSIDITVPAEATAMLPPILSKLSISPYIGKIRVEIKDPYHDPSMVEASSQLLMQCNPYRLQQYDVDAPTSAAVLRHIIQLPSLERFWLIFDSSICQLPDPLPLVVFPSLRVLDVEHSDDNHTWLNLLHAIENPVLSEISVRCLGPDVVQFMETFQLILTGCGMHGCLKVFTLRSRDEFKITPPIIACSFPFKNLTSLQMLSACSNVCQTADLTDGDIDLLTKALPCLGSLMLGDVPCCTPSKITFKSLYTISHRCTRLETLQIHFNPTSFITTVANAEAVDVALGLSNLSSSELCSVTTINVGKIVWQEVSDTSFVVLALGLAGAFPHLENIEHEDNYSWGGINDMIKVFRRMGRFAFGLGLEESILERSRSLN